MLVRSYFMIGVIVVVILTAGCSPFSEPETSRLAFEAPMNVDSEERFHVSLGVRTLGDARFRAYDAFNGKMELRDSTGAEVGRISLATLWELAPGNAGYWASGAHAPNEHVRLEDLPRAVRFNCHMFQGLAQP